MASSEYPVLPNEPTTVFIVDDSLTDIQKCERYVVSPLPLQRLIFVKQLGVVARQFGPAETERRLLPLLRKIAHDPEMAVRQGLADELGALAAVLHNTPFAPRILSTLIPVTEDLLRDGINDVRAVACRAVVALAGFVTPDEVGTVILTKVLNLAHDEADEHRTTAVGLLCQLAPLLNTTLAQNFLAPEMLSFGDDPAFRVRKAAAVAFGHVCEVCTADFSAAKLVPCFVKLSNDPIWGVRRGCVESLVKMAALFSAHRLAVDVLVPMLERFLRDQSRWVRNAAYEVLGPFLHAIGGPRISPELLALYTQAGSLPNSYVDSEVVFHCAFSLPAVALALGSQRFGEIAGFFSSLVNDNRFVVRRTLAHSVHEIARVAGPAAAVKTVLPAFFRFLSDIVEVRAGVVKNVAAMAAALTEEDRMQLLPCIGALSTAEQSRWRHMLAAQIAELVPLFAPTVIASVLWPCTARLLRDDVSSTREEAARATGPLLARLASHFGASPSSPDMRGQGNAAAAAAPSPAPPSPGPPLHEADQLAERALAVAAPPLQSVLREILAMAKAPQYVGRQTFVLACESVLLTPRSGPYDTALAAQLLRLASDRVVNVRFSVARALQRTVKFHAPLRSAPQVASALAALAADKDRDVRAAATTVWDPPSGARLPSESSAASLASASAASASGALSSSSAMVDEEAESKELAAILGLDESEKEKKAEDADDAAAAAAAAAASHSAVSAASAAGGAASLPSGEALSNPTASDMRDASDSDEDDGPAAAAGQASLAPPAEPALIPYFFAPPEPNSPISPVAMPPRRLSHDSNPLPDLALGARAVSSPHRASSPATSPRA